jgi:hypothetical protein
VAHRAVRLGLGGMWHTCVPFGYMLPDVRGGGDLIGTGAGLAAVPLREE